METAEDTDERTRDQSAQPSDQWAPLEDEPPEAEPVKPAPVACPPPRRRATGKRNLRGKRRGPAEKRRGQKQKRRGQEEKREGVTVKTAWSGGKRRWDKKHYCVFCRRPQVKIARHMLRKHADEQEVIAASVLPPGSKQRQLLLEHLRCRGNYLHNIEVIRQGSGEIVPSRQPSEEVDARNYLPCPLCLGFFLRADLWKHQVSCRKKLAIDAANAEAPADAACDSGKSNGGESADGSASEDAGGGGEPPAERAAVDPPESSETGTKRPAPPDAGVDQNAPDAGPNQPRKRARVQAAASRLLPISSGASESCSEILHRMNLDNVSYQVKSDWLICKYGNKLMGNQDGVQKRYDYVSQKLRELGRLLLAAKSLDAGIQNLQDLLAPGHLSLALSAARKASGYRWSRPPLAVKTTLKTICEIAIGENLQDGDWEAAAKTTDFYHMLGREWDNLGLQNPGPDPAADGRDKVKKRPSQPRAEKELRPEALTKTSGRPLPPLIPPDSRLPTPVSVPVKKVHRRPWSTAEKEAIWRQLGVHVLVQTVPGKEVCQRCLDLEPVLRGRHWKDIKNQVHNQIQSQKKQQFHAQMDLEDQEPAEAAHGHKKAPPPPLPQQTQQTQQQQQQTQQTLQTLQPSPRQPHQHQQHQQQRPPSPQQQLSPRHPRPLQLDHEDKSQNHKRPQYPPPQMEPLEDQNHKGPHQYHMQLEHQDQNQRHIQNQNQKKHQEQQDHRKQLYQMDPQPLQSLERDAPLLPVPPFGPDASHRAPGPPLLEREPVLGPYPLLHRAPGPHMDQLLSRADWSEDHLNQNYVLNRNLGLGRTLLQDHVSSGGPQPDPHAGHVHF